VLLVTVVMNLLVFCYQQIIAVIAGQILMVDATRMGVLAGGSTASGAIVVATLLATRNPPGAPGARIFLAGACGGRRAGRRPGAPRAPIPFSLVVQMLPRCLLRCLRLDAGGH